MSLANKHILVIAGPSACGKTTLIAEMLNNRRAANNLLAKLGLDHNLSIGKLTLERLVDSNKLNKKSRKNQVDIALVHFDIFSRYRKARALEFEKVVRSAKSVRLLILYSPFREWLMRMNQRSNYILSVRLSPLSVLKGFFCAGSKGFRPSRKAWIIVMVSRFSKGLGKKIYKYEYTRWDKYWLKYNNILPLYFDSCSGKFFENFPDFD